MVSVNRALSLVLHVTFFAPFFSSFCKGLNEFLW